MINKYIFLGILGFASGAYMINSKAATSEPVVSPADATDGIATLQIAAPDAVDEIKAARRRIIKTKGAPQPIGPYSQAIKIDNLLITSGMIPLDINTGLMVTDIRAATTLVMEYLRAILDEAGMNFSHVIKTTIFLADMSNFAAMNEVYGSYFKDNAPARSTVQAAALPKGACVEIEMTAIMDDLQLQRGERGS